MHPIGVQAINARTKSYAYAKKNSDSDKEEEIGDY
jgi:hypothetical protein